MEHNHKMDQGKNGTLYTCPMHPEVKSDRPGKCPKCGMDLIPQQEKEKHKEIVTKEHQKSLWVHYTVVLIGFHLILSPYSFGYKSQLMTYSDLASGFLLIVFGLLSVNPFRPQAQWASCIIGIWLLFAPVVFWAPEASAFLNNTLAGILVIALTILIPGMPGMTAMMLMMEKGPETPPGWSYNPSAWVQRFPIIILGWIGFFGARYLTAFQLGYINIAWDPFFCAGTENVLTSEVSKAWPISDAGLGTIAYTLEALMGYMGGTDRWRTMPWMVALFGILVIPLGAVSIFLVIMQPVAVGEWCSICLATAIAMLIMIPLTVDEVVAMTQFLIDKKKEGKPFWRTFFMGDTIEGGGKDERSPALTEDLNKTYPAMVWGVTVPWNLLIASFIGVWLMFSPSVFGFNGIFADSNHLIGALVVTISVIAMAEVLRFVRFINVLFGLWFIASHWILNEGPGAGMWNDIITGVLLIAISYPKGKIKENYATYNKYII